MLEVGDRLFSSFGQDAIDALLWTATEPSSRSQSKRRQHFGTWAHLLFALLYLCILLIYKSNELFFFFFIFLFI